MPPACRSRRQPLLAAASLLLVLLLSSACFTRSAHGEPDRQEAASAGPGDAGLQGGLGAEEPLSLPGASEAEPGLELRLGQRVALDHLGPAIVGEDGTLRRIANWDKLTEAEQRVAWRRLAQRNKERLSQLKRQQGVQEQQLWEEGGAETGADPGPDLDLGSASTDSAVGHAGSRSVEGSDAGASSAAAGAAGKDEL